MLLPPAQHLQYSQRWGVLAHKLEKCAEALSLLKFPVALYYARSARHDLHGLQALLQEGARELTTVLDCYEVRTREGRSAFMLRTRGGEICVWVWKLRRANLPK